MKTVRFERQNAVARFVLANPPNNRLDLQFFGMSSGGGY